MCRALWGEGGEEPCLRGLWCRYLAGLAGIWSLSIKGTAQVQLHRLSRVLTSHRDIAWLLQLLQAILWRLPMRVRLQGQVQGRSSKEGETTRNLASLQVALRWGLSWTRLWESSLAFVLNKHQKCAGINTVGLLSLSPSVLLTATVVPHVPGEAAEETDF